MLTIVPSSLIIDFYITPNSPVKLSIMQTKVELSKLTLELLTVSVIDSALTAVFLIIIVLSISVLNTDSSDWIMDDIIVIDDEFIVSDTKFKLLFSTDNVIYEILSAIYSKINES